MCIISGDAHMIAADDGTNNTYGGDTVAFNFKGINATSATANSVLIDYTFDSPKAPPKR